MRIQHNITAMNSYRNYTNNTSAVAKNLEKLSSGYKINRAGDDAAGLAISEKMRAQITGLQTAQKNAKDGISLVKTGEGALTEVHDMLNRMFELAEQSSNGTYDVEVDRANLQKEITSLKSEIDRIADSVNFNGINLLDGSLSGGSSAAAGETITVGSIVADATNFGTGAVAQNAATNDSYTIDAPAANAAAAIAAGKLTLTWKDDRGVTNTIEVATSAIANAATPDTQVETLVDDLNKNKDFAKQFEAAKNEDGDLVITAKSTGAKLTGMTSTTATALGAANATVANTPAAATYATSTLTGDASKLAAGDIITVGNKTYEFVASADDAVTKKGATAVVLGSTVDDTIANFDEVLKKNGYTVSYDVDATDAKDSTMTFSKDGAVAGVGGGVAGSGGLTLQIGDTADEFNQLTVSIKDMHAAAMGISGVDISLQTGASSAMKAIKSAINYVSDVRGDLGATQNRLEHTINNLSVMQENIQDAESSIRDVDVAEEMMAYTKNNILVQSAQAMLAQANQLPQGVLQLLQ